ncbi:MAG TPA: hypothetical protein VM580_20940, partial [Labilithrix sp.]|nr:hypothetical protein [Labilithrix sp.]
MRGSNPEASSGGVIELGSDDLVEVDDNRASIVAAWAKAQDIAMLTGTFGVVSAPLRHPRVRLPTEAQIHPGAASDTEDAELGRLRAVVAARSGDSVGELRARLELARAELERGHVDAARKEAEAAAQAFAHSPAAHAMLRSLRSGREDIDEQLPHVSELISQSAHTGQSADWLCERARLLEARDGVTSESVAVWSEALTLAPEHPGALYGAEVALERAGRHAPFAEVLGRLAALEQNPTVAAWLHVERAIVQDRRLNDAAAARAAFVHALELDPGLGPVRAAFIDYAVSHRDDATLAT